MLTLTGIVMNVLETPKGVSKDGEEYGGYHQVQIQATETLKNGEKRLSLLNLTTDTPEAFKALIGQPALLEVTAWARAKNDVQFQLVKGMKPEAAPAAKKA